ncbi:hypothetical protein SKAU_G00352790 [Synaphobranchus kaupii]|uniref:Uncharacterized protein n=1 Tax=Synaphobranchus kaupii TaxID=118154 RepID=A0A9Q1EKQ2_SYNKA|nr:hypothetical protein SKAU_G00352790 [Synaphobranchus kaupii]
MNNFITMRNKYVTEESALCSQHPQNPVQIASGDNAEGKHSRRTSPVTLDMTTQLEKVETLVQDPALWHLAVESEGRTSSALTMSEDLSPQKKKKKKKERATREGAGPTDGGREAELAELLRKIKELQALRKSDREEWKWERERMEQEREDERNEWRNIKRNMENTMEALDLEKTLVQHLRMEDQEKWSKTTNSLLNQLIVEREAWQIERGQTDRHRRKAAEEWRNEIKEKDKRIAVLELEKKRGLSLMKQDRETLEKERREMEATRKEEVALLQKVLRERDEAIRAEERMRELERQERVKRVEEEKKAINAEMKMKEEKKRAKEAIMAQKTEERRWEQERQEREKEEKKKEKEQRAIIAELKRKEEELLRKDREMTRAQIAEERKRDKERKWWRMEERKVTAAEKNAINENRTFEYENERGEWWKVKKRRKRRKARKLGVFENETKEEDTECCQKFCVRIPI